MLKKTAIYFPNRNLFYKQNHTECSLRKQPSFFAPGPSGVSRDGTRAESDEGRLFSQAILSGTPAQLVNLKLPKNEPKQTVLKVSNSVRPNKHRNPSRPVSC